MGKIIILKDGTSKPIINFSDVTDIIRDNLGDDIVECINEEIEDYSDDLDAYHDMYDEANRNCQTYCDVIFKTQIELEKVINLIKDNPDKNSECAVKSLTELKEMLEET